MTDENSRASAPTPEPCPLPARLRKPNLNGVELSEYLSLAHGLTYAPATLAKFRSIGGGPKFFKTNSSARYPRVEADKWAAEKLGALRTSTSNKGD